MIRLGVVGYGVRINGVVNCALREVEKDVRVMGVVDPDEHGVRDRLADEDKKDVVFYKTLKQMVSRARLDGLIIGTRCHQHTPCAIEAAKYDIPLYLEKPVAISMKQAISLERAFEKSRCDVIISFPLRVSPLCLLAKQTLEEGFVGSCEHIAAVNYVPYGMVYWEEGYRNYKITQGLFLQKATHDLDYMSYLMGSPIVRVAAMATAGRVFGGRKRSGLRCSQCKETDRCLESPKNRQLNHSVGDFPGVNDHLCTFSVDCGTPETGMNEDSSSALVEFASGVHGVYTQVFFARRDAATRGATISGYLGTVSFDWYKNTLRRVWHHKPFTEEVSAGKSLSHFGGDIELAYDFMDLIHGKGKPRSTIWDGIQSVYTCLAAKESAAKDRFVKVRQVGCM
jgi:predicted dehydrogenase